MPVQHVTLLCGAKEMTHVWYDIELLLVNYLFLINLFTADPVKSLHFALLV